MSPFFALDEEKNLDHPDCGAFFTDLDTDMQHKKMRKYKALFRQFSSCSTWLSKSKR